MTEFNPYQQPQADIAVDEAKVGLLVHAPVRRPLGAAMTWLVEGWALFTRNVGVWIGGMLVLWLVRMAADMVPIIGMLVGVVINPLIYAGAYVAADKGDRGEAVMFEDFFSGFQRRTGALLGLGAISLALIALTFGAGGVLTWWLGGGELSSLFSSVSAGEVEANVFALKLTAIVVMWMLVLTPLAGMLWFAMPLIVLSREMTVGRALKWSFIGVMKNMIPLTLFSLVVLVLFILGMLPMLLGLLVVMPLITLSVYRSFYDIFVYEH